MRTNHAVELVDIGHSAFEQIAGKTLLFGVRPLVGEKARLHLGGNWSGTVTIKRGHTLVRTGPYAVVRNPIYTGLLVAALGTAIALGHLRDLAATGTLLALYLYKIRVEERFMTEQFSEQYLQYKRETKTLIPFVW